MLDARLRRGRADGSRSNRRHRYTIHHRPPGLDARAMTLSRAQTALLVAGIITAAAVAVYLMGHPLICKCAYVKLWHFDVMSAENSQHLIDWYTPSHLIHGFLFYWLLWLLSHWIPMSFGLRLVVAVAIEAGWEVIENT